MRREGNMSKGNGSIRIQKHRKIWTQGIGIQRNRDTVNT
jgi:hypothetical protein